MTVEEASGPPIEVWPDNLQAVNLFITLSTQWRTGSSGVVGLDYNVLYQKMDRLKLSSDRYDDLEEEIRVMEGAALDYWAEKSKKAST